MLQKVGTLLETPVADRAASVAGCGAVTALGLGLDPLEHALPANLSGLRPCPRTVDKADRPVVLGRVPASTLEALRAHDPTHADALAFLLASEALRQAGQAAGAVWASAAPGRRGLVLSTTKADVIALEGLRRGEACSSTARRHILPGSLAADLAAAHEIRGPLQCVSAACISGLLALQQGGAMIRRAEADAVAVVGVDLASDFVLTGFTTLKSLDPEGCRPFDKNRVGLSLGEGAGAVVLARRDLVPASSLRVIGWGTSNDANHLTGPSRDGSGLALAIHRALAKAGVAADMIDYVNAHGTGTPYNDTMESLAFRSVFGERVPPFSSSKGMLGHTLGAAGVLETIVCALATRLALLPGTPRLREPDSAVPTSILVAPRPNATIRRLLKINCGFGGTNAALVLESLHIPRGDAH
jgi:3-oxoacyl-(acyl-carrier-protein) synthase